MTLGARGYAGVFLIGFGFFAVAVAWAAYNAYVPLMLNGLGLSTAAIGAVMALDNVFGMTVQPLAGMVSDHTRSRLGRRLPYALIGAPIAAAALVLMPIAAELSVGVLIGVIGVFTFVMAGWRAPIVALMPDLVPSADRSRANGIINLMGSLGAVLMFALGGTLLAAFSYQGPLGFSGVLMVLAVAALVLLVREPQRFRADRFRILQLDDPDLDGTGRAAGAVAGAPAGVALKSIGDLDAATTATRAAHPPADPRPRRRGFLATVRGVIAPPLALDRGERRSLLGMLAAILLYTVGNNAVETFMTLYLHEELAVPETGVTTVLVPYFAAMIVWAVPAGILGHRFGRRNSMLVGLVAAVGVLIAMSFARDVTALMLLLPLFGVLWITVVVNALPLVVEMGGVTHIGTLAAYYYLAGSIGAVVSPVVFGVIRDATGEFSLLFWYAAAAFLAGAIALVTVRHGEARREPASEPTAAATVS